MRCHRISVVFSLFFLWQISVPANSEAHAEELLETIQVGNRAALQSIRTFSCQVLVSNIPADSVASGAPNSLRGNYRRSGDSVRIEWEQYGIFHDIVVKDFRFRTIVRGGGKTRAVIGRLSGHAIGECDVWPLALLTFPDPETGVLVNFDDLLKGPARVSGVKRSSTNGREMVLVDLAHKYSNLQVWFDPTVNYLVRKRIMRSVPQTSRQGKGRVEAEVLEFKEAAPATWFPVKVEMRHYLNDRLVLTRRAAFSKVRVNRPLPAEQFHLPFPHAVTVSDQIEGKEYRADANGKPIGPSRPLAKVPPLPAGVTKRSETVDEPTRLVEWILPVSIGVIVLGGCLWLLRKWRRAAAGD